MVSEGEVHVWRVGRTVEAPPARSALLERALGYAPEVALAPNGKPFLPGMPRVKFSLSRTRSMALIAVAMDVEVGVDIERLRPLPEWRDIARRFFTSETAAAVTGEREFFRQWTRLEAQLKALGIGLPALCRTGGVQCPTVAEIDAGQEYAAAVAASAPGMPVRIH